MRDKSMMGYWSFTILGFAVTALSMSLYRECSLVLGNNSYFLIQFWMLIFGSSAIGYWSVQKTSRIKNGVEISIAGLMSLIAIPVLNVGSSLISVDLGRNIKLNNISGIMVLLCALIIPAILISRTVISAVNSIKRAVHGLLVGAVIGALFSGIVLFTSVGSLITTFIGAAALLFTGIVHWKNEIPIKETGGQKTSPLKTLEKVLQGATTAGVYYLIWRYSSLLFIDSLNTTLVVLLSAGVATWIGFGISSTIGVKRTVTSVWKGGSHSIGITLLLVFFYIPISMLRNALPENESVALLFAVLLFSVPLIFHAGREDVEDNSDSKGHGAFLIGLTISPLLIYGIVNFYGLGVLLYSVFAGSCIHIFLGFLRAKHVGAAWSFCALPFIVLGMFYKSPKQIIRPFAHKSITNDADYNYAENRLRDKSYRLISIDESVRSLVVQKSSVEDSTTMLFDNGVFVDESNYGTNILAVHLPMLLMNNVETVAVVGVGTGEVVQRFTLYPIKQLSLIESEQMTFDNIVNDSLLNSDMVSTIVGESFLALKNSEKCFDLISIQKRNITIPENTRLFTKEYYRAAYSALTENGVISQSVPFSQLDYSMFKRLLKSFVSVFPKSQLWYNRRELILVGFKGNDGTLSNEKARHYLGTINPVSRDLYCNHWGGSRYSLNQFGNLASTFLMNGEQILEIAGSAKPFTLRMPELEIFAAQNKIQEPFIDAILENVSSVDEILAGLSRVEAREISEIREYNLNNIVVDEYLNIYHKTGAVRLIEQAYEMNPLNITVNTILGNHFYKQRDYGKAQKHFLQIYLQDAESRDVGRQLAAIKLQLEQHGEAIKILTQLLKENDRDSDTHALLGVALIQVQKFSMGKQHSEWALQFDPENKMAKQNMEYLNSISWEEQ